MKRSQVDYVAFAGVLGIIVVCLLAGLYLTSQPDGPAVRTLMNCVTSGFNLGCIAIYGLIARRRRN